MTSPRRSLLAVILLFALAAAARSQTAVRRQPETPGTEARIDRWFGDLVDRVAAVPFHDVGPWLGIADAPARVRGDDGQPALSTLTLAAPGGAIVRAQFSPTGRQVLAVDEAHALLVFSVQRAEWRRREGAAAPDPLLAVLTGHTDAITAIAAFPDSPERVQSTDDFYRRAELVTASRDGTARVFRLCSPDEEALANAVAPSQPTRRPARLTLHHGAPVSAVAYSASGRWLATGGENGHAIVWDEQGRRFRDFDTQGSIVTSVWFDGETTLVLRHGIGIQARTRAYDLQSRDEVAPPPPPTLPERLPHQVYTLLPSPNGATLTTEDGTAYPIAAAPGQYRGSVVGSDKTRALLWLGDGTIQVLEWLVRDPSGALARVRVPFVVLWLVLAAVVFTLRFRFVNLRLFRHAIQCVRGRFSAPGDAGEVSHFQALAAALSATVGLGNIAGVAVAVMLGGPGATFWMVIAGLLGMTLKFTECTLGQRFRRIDAGGAVSGGPMHYLRDGIAARWPRLRPLGALLAVTFAVCCIGGSLAGGNAFQVNQSLGILRGQIAFFDQRPWVYGVVMAGLTGIVIIGGIRSIARVADKIVPLMCGLYVLSAATVILLHLGDVPAAIGRIFAGALHGDAVYGGVIGALVTGFRRAAFSNEAGIGSASIAHAAAKTPYPVREGIVALLEPFIDTVVVCTMTALVIGITGVYAAPAHADLVAAGNGAGLTAEAFKSVGAFRGWFPWLLTIAVILFAYSTMISWSYYGERCATHLFGPRASLPFKLLFLLFTVLGSIVTATHALEFGDLMILLMAFPNILGLYLLGGFVARDLADYEARLRNGEIKAQR